jgi:hypothetical protein
MKKKFSKKILRRLLMISQIVIITFAIVLLHGFNNKVYAMDNKLDDTKISYTLGELEEGIHGNPNYTYKKQSDYEFIIKKEIGSIDLDNDIIVIRYLNNSFILPFYDYYEVKDLNEKVVYYQADTLDDVNKDDLIPFVCIYLPSQEQGIDGITLVVQYGVPSEVVLYDITIKLNISEFETVIREPKVLEKESEVYDRLKLARNVSQNGALVNTSEIAAPKALMTINPNQYDSYTNSDKFIHNYASQYFGKHHLPDGRTITDDAIVQLIPKDLLFIIGEHFYIGKEYGFFIRTVQDSINYADFASDIFVFDIYSNLPVFPSDPTGTTGIRPLFQYKYRAVDKNARNGMWDGYDPSLTRVVFAHLHYNSPEYFLNNVRFKHSLENPTKLNPGDIGYDPYQDDGAFIIQLRFNANGVGLKRKGGDVATDTIKFAFGFVPVVNDIISAYDYITGVYRGFAENAYDYQRDSSFAGNEVNIHTFETNNTDQINVRGHLIKAQTTEMGVESDKPRLIHTNGGYAEAKYVVARRSGSNYNLMQVKASILADIVVDNTGRWWLFGWHEYGEVKTWGTAKGTYERSNYDRLSSITLDQYYEKYITAGLNRKVFTVIPKYTGMYRFRTQTVFDSNPRLSLHTVGETSIVYYATNYITSDNGKYSSLDINLEAGKVYIIEAYSSGEHFGYTINMGFSPSSYNTTIYKDVAIQVSVDEKNFKMIRFQPTTSGYYDIFTYSNTGDSDPFLHLFDSNGKRITFNDDTGGTVNSRISTYLYANQIYYIGVHGFNAKAANYWLKVVPSIYYASPTSLNNDKYVRIDDWTYVYEFTAAYTDFYDIYTHTKNSGDPYLELYDSNRNKITYNDDGGGNLNSLITIGLQAGQKYYIHARSYNPAVSTEYYLRINLSTHVTREEIFIDLISSASVNNYLQNISIYKFISPQTRYYTIYTNNVVSGDPYLELMSDQGRILYVDNNSHDGLNAKINFFAYEGEVFYIIARGNSVSIPNSYNLIIN